MSSDAPAPVPGPAGSTSADGLLPTLEVIEQQPLRERAAAYAALLDELTQRLDASPSQA